MAGEKRFSTGLFGFRKADVNYYIEKILKEFDERLREKDNEIEGLKQQNRDIKARCDELVMKIDQINEDRVRIADVIIKANSKAEMIIDEARNQALEEKREIEEQNQIEREKLYDLKQQVRQLKKEVVATLRRFESELESLAGSDDEDAETEAEVAAVYEDKL